MDTEDLGIPALQDWERRLGRHTLEYAGSTPINSNADHGQNSSTAESSSLQPGVLAGLAFTALDETAIGAAPAAGAESAPLTAPAPDGAHLGVLSSNAWHSSAAVPSGVGLGSMSGQGGQAWAPGPAPGPQGASGAGGLHEMVGSDAAAWGPSTGDESPSAYSGSGMGAGSPCESLQGGPTEWMRHDGALGLACAQQVQTAHYSLCRFFPKLDVECL